MADDSMYDDAALPVSAGKLKQLWDAIRTVPTPGPGAPPPPTVAAADQGAPPPVPTLPPPPPPANVAATPAGPVTLPGGTGPLPGESTTGTPLALAVANARANAATGPAPTGKVDTMPNQGPGLDNTPLTISQTPAVFMAPPKQEDTPANKRVAQLEAQVDESNKPATLLQKLAGFLPVALGVGLGAAGKGQAASFIQGVPEAQQRNLEQQNLNRQNLTAQLGAAEQEREKEFDTAQRTQEQANAAMENSRTRDAIARQLGASRETVATTNAGARRDVATIGAGSRERISTGTDATRVRVAELAAQARIAAGKYAADAAANRQTRSLAAAADRQQKGFSHTDEKPTADEDRRADLSMSVGHILDDIEERTNRRPDLIGPIAGRATMLRNKIGSDDEDVTALAADKEALGQLMLGAHAMRNAGHIETAGNSVVNAWNSGPEGMKSAIAQARKNMSTMATITRPTLASKVGTSSSPSKPASPKAKPTGELNYVPGKGIQ